MRFLLAAVLSAAAGCSKAPVFESYRDAGAGYSLEVPKDWPRDADPAPAGKLATRTEFVGEAQPQDEGLILGAVLTVTRLSRKADDNLLAGTKALFPDDAAAAAESGPLARDYEHGGPTPMHQGAAAVPMRAEGKVFRTADAFFVVELRAVRGKFEKHRPVLARALSTFQPD